MIHGVRLYTDLSMADQQDWAELCVATWAMVYPDPEVPVEAEAPEEG